MDALKISQKHKILIFLFLLCTGFIGLAGYTSDSLEKMGEQYTKSTDIANEAFASEQIQVELLQLASTLAELSSENAGDVLTTAENIKSRVEGQTGYLSGVGLGVQAEELTGLVNQYHELMVPWLEMKMQLGLNSDDGTHGKLKRFATVIEEKIAETGMVTLNSDFQVLVKAVQNYQLSPSEDSYNTFERALSSFSSISNSYGMLDMYQEELTVYQSAFENLVSLSAELNRVEKQLFANQQASLEVINHTSEDLNRISQQYQSAAEQKGKSVFWSVMVACAVLAAFTIITFTLISLNIGRSLNQISRVLGSMSEGDLSQRLLVTGNTKDEFNRLANTINQTCKNLGALVKGVQERSETLSRNSADLNVGIDDVVQSQSEVVEQTQLLASATEQVNVTTKQVSENLEQVAEVSRSSSLAAEEGGKVITSAISSMDEMGEILVNATGHTHKLEEASLKVDSVMDIINGVAEQTNLLALNAAIEAARAGEQGRGFAVVADEVRNLAVRTVDAVSEISTTIEAMKSESGKVIGYLSQSEETMQASQARGNEAIQALSVIVEKAEDANQKTEVIFSSIREMAQTSQSMARNMSNISSSMESIDRSNKELRNHSQAVDRHSSSLNEECLRFAV
ncbi:methyl-accepting chemotaxis protein [Vibrio albus]|uniref:Methyl-accepting chemotaxis protein n=1 Tax=Vibrio albus TaxID=2200953 RepID=A0A2U3BDT8_9VIBR|nr:methyl-accepting chemotaxis protein [Vibrio albus]PWI34937.1 methyl-accepting chemotaxis protein [Vibrio albus]